MEIDEAIWGCSDRRLQTKYKNATHVIERTFALYSFDKVAFSFNGGKDSTVLLHLLRAGYFLHRKNVNISNRPIEVTPAFPIRTIYFESASAFPEINLFTCEMASKYDLQLEIIHLDFRSGLENLMRKKPIKAIFLGTRIGDPNAVGQDQFSPSSTGWPPFMRVNPILDWSYRDVWAFILTCKVTYCSLYDNGYTSIGSIHDTVPNALLSVTNSSSKEEHFKPAYLLSDGRLERAGRVKKLSQKSDGSSILSNGEACGERRQTASLVASIIAVGDEILFGTFEDQLATMLCKKLYSIGWRVTHKAVIPNCVDLVAEEVELRKPTSDIIFLFGGLGPLGCDVSVAGVAKAFGVRLAPDEEFEEYLRHRIGDHCTGDRNEMALLPEGITEFLHHDKLPVPLIKCKNVIILSATNVHELDVQWNCLLELPGTPLVQINPFVSKHLQTSVTDIEIAQIYSKLCLDFPDIYTNCHRKSRDGPLIINFFGKELARIDQAAQALCQRFDGGDFSEVSCD